MNHRRILFSAGPSFCSLAGCGLVAWVASTTVRETNAVAFRLPNQDPEAIARGNAFAATADNPSAIYYNPAGITQIEGVDLSFGAYMVSAGTKYTSAAGATAKTDRVFQPVPQAYSVWSPKDSAFSFGLGIYAPYGLGLDWGANNPFNTLAQDGKVLYATINPVVAWHATKTFSIGIGPTINYSQAKFRRALPFPGGGFDFRGDGTDFGFNAGMMWQPCEYVSFGANYRSATEIEYKGHSTLIGAAPRTATSGSIRYPQFAVLGMSVRPTPNWNFEFDLDWTDWDNVNQIAFQGTAVPLPAFVLNYTSGFMYEFGITRKLPHNYWISAGYFYSENSTPDSTYNPIVPDSDLHLGSIGFGHKGQRWDWAVAYHFATNGDGRTVAGSPPGPGGQTADGRYKTFNQAVNISAGFKF